jgi:choice-of-anchor C domain-containing protein
MPVSSPLDDRTRKSAAFIEPSENFERQTRLPDGTILNNTYKVLSFIGAGGMSDVYKCEDLAIGRIVAVKTLQAGFTQEALRRFQTEGKAIAKLEHPNILRLYGLQSTPNGLPILIMEFVPGVTLARLLERKEPFTVQRALRIGAQIGEGLKAAEKEGIVHRDLKPSNIMIVNPNAIDESVKILDFGIAKIQSDLPTTSTRTGDVFGTPQYMSPEQAMGKKCDARSDQYSFGCVLFEMLTGAPPYLADNSLSVMMAHVQDPVPSLANSAKNRIPPHIHIVMTKLLQKDPAQRYATMNDALEALFNSKKSSSVNKKFVGIGLATVLLGIILTAAYCYYQANAEKISKAATIAAKPNVEEILRPPTLTEPTAFDRSLEANFDNLKNRETLHLNDKDLTDAGMKTISRLTNLRHLSIPGCGKVDSKGIAAIQNLNLITLIANGTAVNDDIAESLMKMPNLELLSLNHTDVSSKLCEKLSVSRKLKALFMEETNIDARALPYLANIKSLRTLNLSVDRVEGQLSELQRLQLETLQVKNLKLTPDDINAITSLTTLKTLNVMNTNISDANLISLASLPKLTTLDLEGCLNISVGGVLSFHQKAPLCKVTRHKFKEEENSPNFSTASDTMTTIVLVGPNLSRNGSFEEDNTPPKSENFKAGDKNIPGWQIAEGSIRLFGHNSSAAEGEASIGLNGNGPGAISETFATDHGAPYQVSFQAATDPSPDSKKVEQIVVTVGNQTKTFDVENNNNGKYRQWHRYEWLFDAATNVTTIKFSSKTPGSRGPCIDDISVRRTKGAHKKRIGISPLLNDR